MYNTPEKLEELKAGLREMQERSERGDTTGLDPLQPAFVLAVVNAGGWNIITPLQQEILGKYFTEDKSASDIAYEQHSLGRYPNSSIIHEGRVTQPYRQALKSLYKYYVSVCPDEAKKFPPEIVLRGKARRRWKSRPSH